MRSVSIRRPPKTRGAIRCEDHGKYVEVWNKQADGKWKAVADIFNSDLPVATPPAPKAKAKPRHHHRARAKHRR